MQRPKYYHQDSKGCTSNSIATKYSNPHYYFELDMIKAKSNYEPKNKDDGYRILLTMYYPSGRKKTHFDIWVRELAPR